MSSTSRLNIWLLVAALLGGLGVGLGAFGAHGLESRFKQADGAFTAQDQRKIAHWETAARYQMYHALAVLAIGCLIHQSRSSFLNAAAAAMTVGTLIFSGCLYALVLTDQRVFGAIVPIGGALMLIGWALLALAAASLKAIDKNG